MKIMLDKQFRPHKTCDTEHWKNLKCQGWNIVK